MDVDDAEVGETPSDDSNSTRRDSDGDTEGWIEVTYKRKGRVSYGEETAQKGTRSRSPTRRDGKSIGSKILQASKMPRLPADDIKIIVRPRDGLSIRHTCRASLDEAIRQEAGDLKINGRKYETNAYVSAPEHMAKRIIRNISLKYTHDQLMHAVVNARNPSLAYAKRLGSRTTVILLYEGNRVPMWAYFNSIMMKVSLYRKQIDFCEECGRLGHRPDVGCEEKRGRTPSESRLTRPGHLGKQQHTTSPSTHIKVQIQIQVQAGSLGTTSLGVKVQKQTQDQERAEIHLEVKDARSDNEAARRTEDARQGGLVRRSGQSRFGKIQTSPPSTAIAAFSTPATKTTGERENEAVEMVAVETQQPGAKRKIPLTKTKEQNDSEKEVKRPCSSTKKTDVLEDMINKLSDKMEKMFEMLVVRLSDSEAESKALALKYDKRLEKLEKKIS
ncbi:hypothetical protein HPB51_001637 [Rhipicephalus microplus]|uniref:Uncharacterized protein n=1 Tax=Rhipicephalus microplus TaxID=6941 RepID=A0A9J6EWH5_RHIMP|nr:hypothetical protein HPB51_001637 [Rhipicephalus microplus]